LKCGFQKKVCASKSPTFFSRKTLCVTNVDSSKSTFILQNNIPKANALQRKFWHICIFPMRQANAKNAKEPKFYNRTAPATTMTGSMHILGQLNKANYYDHIQNDHSAQDDQYTMTNALTNTCDMTNRT
jgi:hypothetical protein